jgi:hypothetical protein
MRRAFTIAALGAVILFLSYFLSPALFSTIKWDGSKKVFLAIEPPSVGLSVTRVGYLSHPYEAIKRYSTIPLQPGQSLADILPAAHFPKAEEVFEGNKKLYLLRADGSGSQTMFWEHYEHWNDGFVIWVDLEDGRTFILFERVNLNQQPCLLRIRLTDA